MERKQLVRLPVENLILVFVHSYLPSRQWAIPENAKTLPKSEIERRTGEAYRVLYKEHAVTVPRLERDCGPAQAVSCNAREQRFDRLYISIGALGRYFAWQD